MLNKREERVVRLIVSGLMRKLNIFMLILFFILFLCGSLALILKSNAFIKTFDSKIQKVETDISNIQTATVNESTLKQRLLTQVKIMKDVLPLFFITLTWFIVVGFGTILILSCFFGLIVSQRDGIIKKLVDSKQTFHRDVI